MNYNKKIILESGDVFFGVALNDCSDIIGELIFNTSMVGYQEIITDPANNDKIVILTYPIIGSYGINSDDNESNECTIKGLIVRDYNDFYSNFRADQTIKEKLNKKQIPLLNEVNTRALVKVLSEKGSMNCLITNMDVSDEKGLQQIAEYKNKKTEHYKSSENAWESKVEDAKYHAVCLDLGLKNSTIDQLNYYGFNVTVLSKNMTNSKLLSYKPDVLIVSSGPGNPNDYKEVIELIKSLIGKIPMFGIGLGHELIALANGAKVVKMKIGHHGGNYPIKNNHTGKIEITSQSHLYCVDAKSLNNTNLKVSHYNVLDNSVEGVMDEEKYIYAIAYYPDMSFGPNDCSYLYGTLIANIERFKGEKHA